jgi:hypothetical protein
MALTEPGVDFRVNRHLRKGSEITFDLPKESAYLIRDHDRAQLEGFRSLFIKSPDRAVTQELFYGVKALSGKHGQDNQWQES